MTDNCPICAADITIDGIGVTLDDGWAEAVYECGSTWRVKGAAMVSTSIKCEAKHGN